MAERQEVSAHNTLHKNRFVLDSLNTYADDKGYISTQAGQAKGRLPWSALRPAA